MFNEKWEVIVQEEPGLWMVRVYLIQKGNTVKIAHIKGSQVEVEDIKEGLNSEPTFTINIEVWRALKESLIDHEVKSKQETDIELSLTRGELTATKFHLQDMRVLAGLVPTITGKPIKK